MLILANGRQFEISHADSAAIETELQQIYKDLLDQNEIVQEVVIDGTAYREGYNELLLHNSASIREVEIRTVNGDVLVSDILDELKGYLPRLIQAFDSISELFYGEMNQEDWGYFAQLSEGIQWVIASAQIMSSHIDRVGSWLEYQSAVNTFIQDAITQLGELETALQANDFTSVGDLIKYEMPDVFRPLLECLENGGQA